MKHGANPNARLDVGYSILTCAAENPDSEPVVVRRILDALEKLSVSKEQLAPMINAPARPRTNMWRCILGTASVMKFVGLSDHALVGGRNMWLGATALHCACRRGDAEVVEILIQYGADPGVRDGFGRSASDICEAFGPFPVVEAALAKAP